MNERKNTIDKKLKGILKKYPRVLVVEDDSYQLEKIQKNLENIGFTCTAPRIEEGKQLKETVKEIIAHSDHFDWAVLDVALHSNSDSDGIELAKFLNKKRERPIMYLTAMGMDYLNKHLTETSFARWISKMFTRSKTQNKIPQTTAMDKSKALALDTLKTSVIQFLYQTKIGVHDIYEYNDRLISVNGHHIPLTEVAFVTSKEEDVDRKMPTNVYIKQGKIYETYYKLNDFATTEKTKAEPKYKRPYFYRCHQSYVINLNNNIIKFEYGRRSSERWLELKPIWGKESEKKFLHTKEVKIPLSMGAATHLRRLFK